MTAISRRKTLKSTSSMALVFKCIFPRMSTSSYVNQHTNKNLNCENTDITLRTDSWWIEFQLSIQRLKYIAGIPFHKHFHCLTEEVVGLFIFLFAVSFITRCLYSLWSCNFSINWKRLFKLSLFIMTNLRRQTLKRMTELYSGLDIWVNVFMSFIFNKNELNLVWNKFP